MITGIVRFDAAKFKSIVFTGSGYGLYNFCRACLREFEKREEALGYSLRADDRLTELIAVCDRECLEEYRSLEYVKEN